MNIQKCAIVGCGMDFGATAAYTLLGSGLFNELVLIDINQKKAEGEAMDIGHGVPFIHPVEIYAGTYEDLADAYLVIVTAGANQLPGESRINLTEKNVRIFQSIIPEIVRYNTECLLLIVANPVDILTTVALRLSGFPPERVIGSGTVLDSSRFKYRLGEYIGIDHRNVHAFIIGEHGDSEVAVWSSATVSGIAVRDFCYDFGIVFTRERLHHVWHQAPGTGRDDGRSVRLPHQAQHLHLLHRLRRDRPAESRQQHLEHGEGLRCDRPDPDG